MRYTLSGFVLAEHGACAESPGNFKTNYKVSVMAFTNFNTKYMHILTSFLFNFTQDAE